MTLPTVSLKPRRAQPILNRHPWVFEGAIGQVSGDPAPGAEVLVQSKDAQPIGRGLFNPNSNIRVRMFSWDKDEPINEALFAARINEAATLRESIVDPKTTSACRVFFSESDGLSGLIVDRYGDWLLVQLTSLALAERREVLFDLLEKRFAPRGIWLRTEKGIREAEGLEIADGLVRGEEPPRPISIFENGLTFQVDVTQGQKTGGFLDQRENHFAVSKLVRGHRILDMFCYAGGFGITAVALGEAASIVGVDSSEPALELARINAELNGVADRTEFLKADAFKYLEEANARGEMFDTVILDPPKMTRRRSGLAGAMRGYRSLNELSVTLLRPGGLLVTCSCSGLISQSDMESMLATVSTSTNRRIQILESRGQAADHPVSPNCPENAYLKCFVCRVT
ncbi:MAG: class I SAM-dependent rRNA methyltransferase [Planctomycetota bacterium]|nr:class I SAM-dependent rRNA methyltransferase [Planctomycetota bacterium]MDA1249412.1 class I SAM-dependent rRNA methyltransferase [Planctomycetota bacterium]